MINLGLFLAKLTKQCKVEERSQFQKEEFWLSVAAVTEWKKRVKGKIIKLLNIHNEGSSS